MAPWPPSLDPPLAAPDYTLAHLSWCYRMFLTAHKLYTVEEEEEEKQNGFNTKMPPCHRGVD